MASFNPVPVTRSLASGALGLLTAVALQTAVAPLTALALQTALAPLTALALLTALAPLTALALLGLNGVSPSRARPLPAEEAPIPQIPRDNWKDCSFNDRLIGCQDRELADGVRIDWRDGRSMTYRLIDEGFPVSLLRDRHGGLWQREILVQGNAVYTNVVLGKSVLGKSVLGKSVLGKSVLGKPVLGKAVLGKAANGNRIVVPLRLTCKPPLMGEVGYCQRP